MSKTKKEDKKPIEEAKMNESAMNQSKISNQNKSVLESIKESKSIVQQKVDEVGTKEDIDVLNHKTQILKDSKILEAYEYFLRRLCKDGFPSGNIFEYAAQQIQTFDQKRKAENVKKGVAKATIDEVAGTLKFEKKVEDTPETRETGRSKQFSIKDEGKNASLHQTPVDSGEKSKKKEVSQPKDQKNVVVKEQDAEKLKSEQLPKKKELVKVPEPPKDQVKMKQTEVEKEKPQEDVKGGKQGNKNAPELKKK